MSDRVIIREMQPDDARATLEVHYDAVHNIGKADYPPEIVDQWSMPVDAARIEHFLKNPGNEIRLIAEIEGKIVGFGALVIASNELRACYVASRNARQSIGTYLVREIEKIAAAAGLDYLQLDSSLTAEKFYRRNGYKSLGRGKHALSKGGMQMDCVKMRKELAQ